MLMIVQPLVATYRAPLFTGLTQFFDDIVILAAPAGKGSGFGQVRLDGCEQIETPRTNLFGARMYIQRGVLRTLWRRRPTVLFVAADFRALHFWSLLLLAPMLGTPVFAHGQGVYNKFGRRTFPIYRHVMNWVVKRTESYVCYTSSVRDQMISCGMPAHKLSVMENTVFNEYPVPPEQKKSKPGRLLFVGRLRKAVRLDLLFLAMELLRSRGLVVHLDVIGDGIERAEFEKLAESKSLSVQFHGAIHDDRIIRDISQLCQIGIYPGDAGLSMVHYMSLSLVPVVHDTMELHMGPEPAYIHDGHNGVLFRRNDPESLARALEWLITDPTRSFKIAEQAYNTWVGLSRQTMAEILAAIIERAELTTEADAGAGRILR